MSSLRYVHHDLVHPGGSVWQQIVEGNAQRRALIISSSPFSGGGVQLSVRLGPAPANAVTGGLRLPSAVPGASGYLELCWSCYRDAICQPWFAWSPTGGPYYALEVIDDDAPGECIEPSMEVRGD